MTKDENSKFKHKFTKNLHANYCYFYRVITQPVSLLIHSNLMTFDPLMQVIIHDTRKKDKYCKM